MAIFRPCLLLLISIFTGSDWNCFVSCKTRWPLKNVDFLYNFILPDTGAQYGHPQDIKYMCVIQTCENCESSYVMYSQHSCEAIYYLWKISVLNNGVDISIRFKKLKEKYFICVTELWKAFFKGKRFIRCIYYKCLQFYYFFSYSELFKILKYSF